MMVVAGILLYQWESTQIEKNTEAKKIELGIPSVKDIQNTPLVPDSVEPVSQNVTREDNNKKIMNAIIHTNKGDITIEFNGETPKTVANFVDLAGKGFYDGTKFHRVIKGFMSQGGDPYSKDDTKMSQWGTGGPGYQFDDEIGANNKNNTNTISMANAGPNTNGSQFFINAANNNFLDTKHTVFGKVTAGLDVVKAINSVATDSSDRPKEPVIIKSITLK
jgi:peptidylprolyl isomerase